MSEEIVLMIVPGPLDRAFYKAFITKLYDNVEDLDSTTYKEEKDKLLKSVIKSTSYKWAKASVLRMLNNRLLMLIIKPSEKSVKEDVKILLKYLLGYEDSKVRHIVITEDAEEHEFSVRLQGLIDSIKSLQVSEKDIEVVELDRKSTYAQLLIKGPKTSINLFIMIQGIPELKIFNISLIKHAIEDYVIYMYYDDFMKVIPDRLLTMFSKNILHKKIAILIALLRCYSSVEELLFSTDRSYYEKLVNNVECLRAFKKTFLDSYVHFTL